MTHEASQLPCIAVVSAGPNERPPGLSALEGRAEILHASEPEALKKALQRAEVLLVTDFRTPLVEEAFGSARRLRWVHAASAGVDRLAFPALIESEVVLTNASGVFDDAIAEYVAGAVLAFAKDFLGSVALAREARWKHRETERVEGKRLLMVGAGSIGSAIARRARALGLSVVGVARSAREHPDFERVVASEDLPEELPQADYVALATPLTEQTHHMIDADALSRMKPGARLINVGRGGLVDTDALVNALQGGTLAGAALDVFEQEPLPPEHPLWSLPNVLISAHMAGDFIGWREALTRQFVDNFERYARGESLFNVVDKSQHRHEPEESSS